MPSFSLGQTVGVDMKQLAVGNTNTDGVTGTYVTLKTAGVKGSVVTAVDVFAAGTVAAGKIRFYTYDGVSVTQLIDELLVPATVPTPSTGSYKTTWYPPGGTLTLPAGWTLKAAPYNTETYNLTVHSFDY